MIVETIKQKIQTESNMSVIDSFDIARQCSIFLKDKDSANNGRKIIVHILNNWERIPIETHEMWTDLIEVAGFYPYLEKEKKNIKFSNLSGEIRKELHFANELINDKKIYFHEEQKILKNILRSGKNLIVSAPTSFGKSILIEDIVSSNKYKNIVVIQPTLALLDETRKKLKKYKESYNIIVRTSQKALTHKANIFLLTAERVLEYKDFPQIDFLVIDEFYKLSTARDDERADHLNNSFYYLLKNFNPQFYLLGPNIEGISIGFEEQFNALFYKTDYSLIDTKIIDIYPEHQDKFSQPRKYKEYKEEVLFNLLYELKDEQSIIYCSSPNRVRDLAYKFSKYLARMDFQKNNNISLIEWIKLYVDEKWNLINFLEYHIGINDGALQKHINSSMIKYFNDEKLKYLFCTSTIIEGVNTSAKNIIVFDSTKGGKPIDFFDYSNIKGRSGRMMIHYVGKIYNFKAPPEQERIIIDIPFFEQSENPKEFSPEIEIAIDESDIKNKNREQYKKLKQLPFAEKEIFKKNGVLVNGQINILNQLKFDIHKKRNLVVWNGSPNYEQLKYVLELCWDNLLKEGETTSPMTKKRITKVTFDYGIKKSVQYLIDSTYIFFKEKDRFPKLNDTDILNEAIRESFQILRHWFQYKVPKWLSVVHELQLYVCKQNNITPGNYTWYASQLENDFIQDNLTILSEYGIPKSAIEKLQKNIDDGLDEQSVIKKTIEYMNKKGNDLLIYEIEKINESL